MFLESPEVMLDVLHIITTISCPFQVFGIYCILFKTPKTMVSIKWILLNLHVCCLLFDLGLTVLSAPCLILPAMAGFPLGILWTIFEVPIIFQTYLIFTSLLMVCNAILVMVENRYYQMFARNKAWHHFRLPYIFLLTILNMTCALTLYYYVPDQPAALEYVYKQVPNIPAEFKSRPMFVLSIDIGVPIAEFILIIIFLFSNGIIFIALIHWNMNSSTIKQVKSTQTRKMEKKFLLAIYVQAGVVMIALLCPATYVIFSVFNDYYNQAANNCMFISFAFHGIFSTLILLWGYKPYRKFCMDIMKSIKAYREKTTLAVGTAEVSRLRNAMV
ncbi:Serpentine Receptor, class H [Caenorhabditis elegans]|uniref:Serpentine Receptor, class H n=1 Tax=Caenorhabditis elegans TaxID=6239 RepID=Q7YXB0_CAEEL|nr:Serpentine Receptor, class H [Caenorhabditis elegans]CAE11306.1 Serpentine Receptor, class H [Caenorhabditis elegans]|eukprot:NP_001023867.1 Serpentine Receptor, class H [Caenorhabditis elegans]